MAKKAPVAEEKFSPLDKSTILSVMSPPATSKEEKKEVPTEEVPPPKTKKEAKPKPKPKLMEKPLAGRGGNRLDVAKRVLLSQEESAALDVFTAQLAAALGTPLKTSHILRGMLRAIHQSEKKILQAATGAVPMVRPANGDSAGMAEYEGRLAEIILSGVKG